MNDMPPTMRPLMVLALGLAAVLPAAAQTADSGCGPLANAYGPFDYRFERGNSLYLVESAHFTPRIEALIRDQTSRLVGGDLDYTLRAFPNHHRALNAMIRLGEKEKSPVPKGARYSVECWLKRATLFKPDDTVARLFYVSFLQKGGRTEEAANQLLLAAHSAGDNAFSHFNIGLFYFEMKDYDHALLHAQKAELLGFPRATLKERLAAVGKWVAPPAPAASAADATSSPGASQGPAADALAPGDAPSQRR